MTPELDRRFPIKTYEGEEAKLIYATAQAVYMALRKHLPSPAQGTNALSLALAMVFHENANDPTEKHVDGFLAAFNDDVKMQLRQLVAGETKQ